MNYEPLSEIEVELWGYRAILQNPVPFVDRYSYWICPDPGVKAALDLETMRAFEEGQCVSSTTGFPDWATTVGRVVAQRIGAKIVREKLFNVEEYLQRYPPLPKDDALA
jgi:hypothetical protein